MVTNGKVSVKSGYIIELIFHTMKSKTEYQLNPEMEEAARAVKTQKKHYYDYSSEQKLLFVYYNDRVKLFNAAKSGRLAGGIAERTA